MKSPIEDTRWGSGYGSAAMVRAAFDRFGPEYHDAIMESGVPSKAAAALMPHLSPDAQGLDYGCGSGVLGLALRALNLRVPLDGLDLSPGMLELARASGCYRHLLPANLLLPWECPPLPAPYDFAITVGLIGDYVPYYLALPHLVSLLKPGGLLGFAVEQGGTPFYPLEKQMAELGLALISETDLPVVEGKLERQMYRFFVVHLPARKE